MKKKMSRLMTLTLAGAMLLSGCGGAEKISDKNSAKISAAEDKESEVTEPKNDSEDKYQIKNLVLAQTAANEMETFNALYSQYNKEHEILCNAVDALLELDSYGKLKPAIAKEWGTTDGGLTWTFKLREDVKWVDMNAQEKADCNAQDFVTGLEWVLNFHKNDSVNTSMPIEMIKGAEEYYEYTKSLSKEEAYALNAGEGSKFREMVGVEAPDDYTVVYHCITEKPYFDGVATYACLFPMAQGMIDELGGPDGVRSMDNTNMWYNGCYTITSYIQGNEKVLTKNPTYWDKECHLFDTVTVKMVESNDVVFQLYQSGEVDDTSLTESNLKTISSNKNHEFYNYLIEKLPTQYSWQIHFNYDKMNEDGTPDQNWNTAVANEAFRLSWYYGLDLLPSYKRINAVNPMSCENNAYTMKGLAYASDGTDYADMVHQELALPEPNGKTLLRLDAEKAKQYKEQAMTELKALGVTFPVMVDYYVPAASQTALDSANVFAQAVEDSLGNDYVRLNVKTYVTSPIQEVYKPRFHSLCSMGWGADYGDPKNYLGQEVMGKDNAAFAQQFSYINNVKETEATKDLLDHYREFTRLVEEADKISNDLDARYRVFAKAEAYMIQHALVIPHYYEVGWSLSKINPYSQINAKFGSQNGKKKNWETNKEGYTTEEMKAIAEEHHAKAKSE